MTTDREREVPHVQFKPLHRADGSALFKDQLHSILVSVNGPVEVQRRDELPEEAAIEVNIRPASGVGGPRERWLEEVLGCLLKNILLVHLYPRTLIQITLQFTSETENMTKGRTDIAAVSSLVNAAFAGLVDAGLPLATTAIAGLAIIDAGGQVVNHPSAAELSSSKSVHIMVFDKDSTLLLDESAGSFSLPQWQQVTTQVKDDCLEALRTDESDEDAMDLVEQNRIPWLRHALDTKIRQTSAWRETT